MKSRVVPIVAIPFLAIVIWLAVHFCPEISVDEDKIVDFYIAKLREPLFSGFLTIGGFLFSLKTFIITIMKKEVYDTDEYEKRVHKLKAFDDSVKKYDNLKNLSDMLFYIVFVSIITALFQFTVGLVEHLVATLICLFLALYNMCLLLKGAASMKENLDFLYNFDDEKSSQ